MSISDRKIYSKGLIPDSTKGRVQKVKCTICSYENNLTVTINSNLITDKFENEFSRLLKHHVGSFRLEQD